MANVLLDFLRELAIGAAADKAREKVSPYINETLAEFAKPQVALTPDARMIDGYPSMSSGLPAETAPYRPNASFQAEPVAPQDLQDMLKMAAESQQSIAGSEDLRRKDYPADGMTFAEEQQYKDEYLTPKQPIDYADMDARLEQQFRMNELDREIARENQANVQDFVRNAVGATREPIKRAADLPDEKALMQQLDPAKLEAEGITPQKAYELTKAAGALNLVPEYKRVAEETGDDSLLSSFSKKLKAAFSDEKTLLGMAMAFNGLRYRPDENLAKYARERIKQIDDLRAGNRTIDALRAKGVDENTLNAIKGSPELMKSVATKILTKGYADTSAEQRFFEELTKDLTPEQKQEAIDIKLGRKPRAGSQYSQTLEQMLIWEKTKAMGKASGKSEVEQEENARKNARAFEVYQSGISGLEQDLLGTSTGYFQGMLPAITSSQQKADMAINRMAPLLKNIFRESGEGVFTDRDQELLIGMIPTRGTNPEVIASSIKAINDIVRLKLGASAEKPQAATQQSAAKPQITPEQAAAELARRRGK